ncbi:unnamed protein product [Scytosiphon promiscuus]
MSPPNQRRSPLLGYVYASPLVSFENNRREMMAQLGTHEELQMIRKKLKDSGRQIKFRAVVATPSNLRELLNSDCRMLHYTGHGNNEFLAFESNKSTKCGVMEPLKVEPLKKLFQAGGVRTELVFISSCSSELTGNAFVEAGVPHVVAVKREESVTDQAAQLFATQFYDALMSHNGRYTVQEAFDIALHLVNATNTNTHPQGEHFLLLPAGRGHDVRIFDTLPEGVLIDETKSPPPRPAGAKPVPFYKGLVELQKVVGMLVDPVAACVTVTGERGSGKRERAVQACDYVRKRHHYDAVFWADLKRAAPSPGAPDARIEHGDLCRLIGTAIGMPAPGPSTELELIQFLFRSPTTPEGVPPVRVHKVLLVLEKVDTLFESGGDAKDRVLKLLSNLCSMGGHLKLLVTSEQALQRDTYERFRHGSEKVARVKPLRPRDAAQLLVDNVPTRFTKKELGLPPDCTRDEILFKLQEHPVLQAAGGHPGTLLRLAPLLEDHSLNDACVLQRAEKPWCMLNGAKVFLHALFGVVAMSCLSSLLMMEGVGMNHGHRRGVSWCRVLSLSRGFLAQSPTTPTSPTALTPAYSHDTHFLQQQQQGHNNGTHPSGPRGQPRKRPPRMTAQEKRAWDTARTAGLIDRGCRLVWVKATANAAADGWVTRYDFVPWEYLQEGLKQHLCGRLTIPSSHNEVVDDGPVGWINDDLDGGSVPEGGGYGAVNTPQVRWMNEDELAFVRGVLKTKQDKVRQKQERVRKQMADGGFDGADLASVAAANAVAGLGGDEGGPAGGGSEEDVVSLEAFVEFSLWWAPLMGTLSLLKNDWASTDPIRVHGFIGRLAAERELGQTERGTFLLRFSESKQGALVISFTEHVTQAPGGPARSSRGSPSHPQCGTGLRPRSTANCIVKHCLVEVRQGGRCFIEVEQGNTVPYPSLHALVRACTSMQTLFPNVPKENAFDDDAGISMYPPDGVVLSLEEWGSRPIEMVLVDDDLDAEMTLAAPV